MTEIPLKINAILFTSYKSYFDCFAQAGKMYKNAINGGLNLIETKTYYENGQYKLRLLVYMDIDKDNLDEKYHEEAEKFVAWEIL